MDELNIRNIAEQMDEEQFEGPAVSSPIPGFDGDEPSMPMPDEGPEEYSGPDGIGDDMATVPVTIDAEALLELLKMAKEKGCSEGGGDSEVEGDFEEIESEVEADAETDETETDETETDETETDETETDTETDSEETDSEEEEVEEVEEGKKSRKAITEGVDDEESEEEESEESDEEGPGDLPPEFGGGEESEEEAEESDEIGSDDLPPEFGGGEAEEKIPPVELADAEAEAEVIEEPGSEIDSGDCAELVIKLIAMSADGGVVTLADLPELQQSFSPDEAVPCGEDLPGDAIPGDTEMPGDGDEIPMPGDGAAESLPGGEEIPPPPGGEEMPPIDGGEEGGEEPIIGDEASEIEGGGEEIPEMESIKAVEEISEAGAVVHAPPGKKGEQVKDIARGKKPWEDDDEEDEDDDKLAEAVAAIASEILKADVFVKPSKNSDGVEFMGDDATFTKLHEAIETELALLSEGKKDKMGISSAMSKYQRCSPIRGAGRLFYVFR